MFPKLPINARKKNVEYVRIMSGSCYIRRVEIVVELGIFVFF